MWLGSTSIGVLKIVSRVLRASTSLCQDSRTATIVKQMKHHHLTEQNAVRICVYYVAKFLLEWEFQGESCCEKHNYLKDLGPVVQN